MILPRGQMTHKGPGRKDIPGATPYGKCTLDVAYALGLADSLNMEYIEVDQRLRPYQQEASRWLARRGYGILGLPPQTGKTITSLLTAKAIGAKRILVLCPAGARGVWAKEIDRWLGITPVLLFGRGGDKVRSYGTRWYAYKNKPKTAQAYDALINDSPIIVCNYEILTAQHAKDEAGRETICKGLPGWESVLAELSFDVAILDETHEFRGWSSSTKRKQSWQRVKSAISGAKRAWGLTGTPFCGYKKDIWPQLQVLSDGLYGYKDTPFSFHARYCDGHKGKYGWVATGSSNEAELEKRMQILLYAPSMESLMPDLPPKQRVVVPIENDKNLCTGATGATTSETRKLCQRTLKYKLPVCRSKIEEVLHARQKTIVYTMWRDNADEVFKELQKIKVKQFPGFRLWRGTGDDNCDAVADQFRNHEGPGILVGTTQAWKGYRNLQGALTIHVLEVDHDPGAMLQAENRPYAKDKNGLTIFYYEVENSIDTYMVTRLVNKLEALEGVADTGITEIRDAGPLDLDDIFGQMMGDLL